MIWFSSEGLNHMLTYDPLRDHLRDHNLKELELSFDEIEKLIGKPLPPSAERPQWWANQIGGKRPQRDAWRDAGFDAFLVSGSRRVKFRRK
jgi:hypothetical protein